MSAGPLASDPAISSPQARLASRIAARRQASANSSGLKATLPSAPRPLASIGSQRPLSHSLASSGKGTQSSLTLGQSRFSSQDAQDNDEDDDDEDVDDDGDDGDQSDASGNRRGSTCTGGCKNGGGCGCNRRRRRRRDRWSNSWGYYWNPYGMQYSWSPYQYGDTVNPTLAELAMYNQYTGLLQDPQEGYTAIIPPAQPWSDGTNLVAAAVGKTQAVAGNPPMPANADASGSPSQQKPNPAQASEGGGGEKPHKEARPHLFDVAALVFALCVLGFLLFGIGVLIVRKQDARMQPASSSRSASPPNSVSASTSSLPSSIQSASSAGSSSSSGSSVGRRGPIFTGSPISLE